MSEILRCENVGLQIAGKSILQNISFTLQAGERLAIVGPSGCGKSSLLGLISGIRAASGGQILYRGEAVSGPSRERVIIFQSHALFPWKTAGQNVEFALKARGAMGDRRIAAMEYLKMMGLEKSYDLYPHELSGGMQQRVGIARALAAQPDLLLLDEPFAALDALTKESVVEDVVELMKEQGKSLILITHSIEEALFVGDRVLVMTGAPGKIAHQIATPKQKPTNLMGFKHQADFMTLESQIYRNFQQQGANL
jgi:NitT/TauT family transport system ATP-binding protein